MSDSQDAGFGKFVRGFDFLQNLAKGASQTVPQMPNLANWIAPTLNVEELEKRISELKTVHFWLEQNSKALGATVQALEVQKMTLATLKGMNFNIGDVANSLKMKAADSMFSTPPRAPEKASPPSKTIAEMAAEVEAAAAAQKARDAVPPAAAAAAPVTPPVAVPGMIDPMQLWGALSQQFQQIAASAMKEVNASAAMDATKNMAAGFVKEAVSATKKAAASVVHSSEPAKIPAKAANKPVAKTAAKTAAKKVAKTTTGRSS